MRKTEKSYQWQILAFDSMTLEERMSKRDEQLKMTERTYKLQDFVTSFKMSGFFLKQFCSRLRCQQMTCEVHCHCAAYLLTHCHHTIAHHHQCLLDPLNLIVQGACRITPQDPLCLNEGTTCLVPEGLALV